MKRSKLLIGALAGLGFFSVAAQELSIDAMIRPRFEYRHGFQDVVPKDAEGSAFVSQRSSLLLKYSDAKITTFLDLQDTSIWGDREQLSTDDGSINGRGFRVNRAWAQIGLGNGWATKVGRQFLSYDDQRILGALGWADQQRTHDAALLKYSKANLKLDLGFAFNQKGITNAGNSFLATGLGTGLFRYKAMQFAHLSGKLSEGWNGSFLFMNNTFETVAGGAATQTTFSKQTAGVFSKYKGDGYGLTGSFYYQFGEFNEAVDIDAIQASLAVNFKAGSTPITIGGEYLSGNDPDTPEQEAFFPLFGTNHKFNGFQDFFYVGRHANRNGLIDLNAKAVFKLSEKAKLLTKAHYFSTATEKLANAPYEGYLGTSIDLVYIRKITSYANVKVGYSQSFLDSEFADARAGGEADDVQNWGWVMLTVKPNLFKWKKPAETK